jgi:hypothetical protein
MKVMFPCCAELTLQYILPQWIKQFCPGEIYSVKLTSESNIWVTYVTFESDVTYTIFALTFEEWVLTSIDPILHYLIDEGFRVID